LDVILAEVGKRGAIAATTCCWILKTCRINYRNGKVLLAGRAAKN